MPSFDIVSKVPWHEVDNALMQSQKEVAQRFDFKDTSTELEKTGEELFVRSSTEDRAKAALTVLQEKLIKRKVSTKFLDIEKPEPTGKGGSRIRVKVKEGVDQDKARAILTAIKEAKLKVQASIQGGQVRVTGKNKNDLQACIQMLRSQDFDIELQFINFRDLRMDAKPKSSRSPRKASALTTAESTATITATDPTATPTASPSHTRKLFGTDGVRGVANEPPMTPEMALRLGRAIAFVARRGHTRPVRIVIGKDTRVSCYMLETALAAGVCAMGGRVMLCGPVPTPAVAHLTTSMRADAGVVISASHNAFHDNGIKLFGPDGFKLPDSEEAEIERLMESAELERERPTGALIGRAERIEDARGRYTVFCKSAFPKDLSLDGLRIVVDAAHGAAYRMAPSVFSELGAEVTALGCRPNGRNINHKVGALHPGHAAAEVRKQAAQIGVALDGDADRVILIDEQGQVVDGDAVMALCATRMLAQGKLARGTLVATVMSNLGLEHAMKTAGGMLVRTAVGDRYVVEAMRSGRYNMGGEQSGHLVFLDHCTTGDGLIAALQVLSIMIREGKALSELAGSVMERVPQILKNITLATRKPLETMSHLNKTEQHIARKLGKNGRVLVRWSGTEPKLRVMVEGEDIATINLFADELIEAARQDIRELTD